MNEYKGYQFPAHSTSAGRKTVYNAQKAVTDTLKHLPTGTLVLVGLSGGADSLALAAIVSDVAPKLGLSAGAVCINHNLQDGSREVSETAKLHADNLGLTPNLILDIEPYSDNAADPDLSEARARNARYELFEQAMATTGAEYILTAHTTDDNAEQVLLGLLRGSGTRSLAGMPKTRDYVIRPFLDSVSRKNTESICVEKDLDFWSDPHNEKTEITRVMIRKNILPYIQSELGGNLKEALNRTAEISREDADALDDIALFQYDELVRLDDNDNFIVSAEELMLLSKAVRYRVIRLIGANFTESYSRTHVLAVANLVENWHGQKEVNVPKTTVKRVDGILIFSAR